MRATLRTADGAELWAGDLDSLDDCRRLTHVVGEHRNRVRARYFVGVARNRRVAQGLCRECGERPLVTANHCEVCRELHNECSRDWKRAHRGKG